ncbi:MAG: class I SAM-dependent methyltransferase [Candidatus Buchananbacteria bacterium]
MNKKSIIEKKTGDLYNSCFLSLSNDQWYYQGELLGEQLGLDEQGVKNKICLDGGCGHGALVYRLLQLGADKVVGFDLEPTPKLEKFSNYNNFQFIQGSLTDMPFADNSFDLVVTSGVLHHTVNPQKCASELARILKPGANLIIGVYGKYGLFPWLLSLARIFTVKTNLIKCHTVDKFISKFNFDPIWRYQILDYLFVPILKRYTPKQVKKNFFLANGVVNPIRVSNITKEKGKKFTGLNTSYSYDYRTLKSRILFGHGFIVIKGEKK